VVKVFIGYDLPGGLSEAEHEAWLKDIHLADMDRVPGLEKAVLNKSRWVVIGNGAPAYLAELHYSDMDAYLASRDWLAANPFGPESQPTGKMTIKFLIVCESELLPLHNIDPPY
jgi:hypothetical protein